MQVAHSPEAMPEGVDSLVVLGKQYGIGSSRADVEKSPDHLSDDSRMNVIAAGMLWTPDAGRILLSGNKKAFFPGAASEYLEEHFPHIPRESYANPDDDSPNTLASTINVPEILADEGRSQAALVTVGFHIKRAVNMFNRQSGIVACAAASEDIRATRSEEDEEAVGEWKKLTRVKLEIVKEFVARRVDAGGRVSDRAIRAVRP